MTSNDVQIAMMKKHAMKDEMAAVRDVLNKAVIPPAEYFPPCTCHQDDNPPRPCPHKYAYSDCVAAADLAGRRARS